MIRKIAIAFFLAISAGGALLAMAKRAPAVHQVDSQAIGVRTVRFEDRQRNRSVLVELWYPTHEVSSLDRTDDQIWLHPKEARDAPLFIAGRSHPLIIMSHGHRGDRRERSWLADMLVRQGYVVASVEHFGNTWSGYDPAVSVRFWERARDISFVLDQLPNHPFVSGKVDFTKVGFVGYSMGGMTGLALAGGRIRNVREIVLEQQERVKELSREELEKIDFSPSEQNFLESRISAMLLICPANFGFTSESLKQIKIPIGLIVSVDDEVLPHEQHGYVLLKNLAPAKLKLLRSGISHYAFLNPLSEMGRKVLKKSFSPNSDPESLKAIHAETGEFAVSFFAELLPQNK